jgi:hypothetical protein
MRVSSPPLREVVVRLLFAPSVLLLAALSSACASDAKGNSCGLLDMYVASDEQTYCPDPEAPEACEDLVDEMLASFAGCAQEAGLSVDEEALRADLESRGSLPDCIDLLRDPECTAGTPELGDTCRGVVLTAP